MAEYIPTNTCTECGKERCLTFRVSMRGDGTRHLTLATTPYKTHRCKPCAERQMEKLNAKTRADRQRGREEHPFVPVQQDANDDMRGRTWPEAFEELREVEAAAKEQRQAYLQAFAERLDMSRRITKRQQRIDAARRQVELARGRERNAMRRGPHYNEINECSEALEAAARAAGLKVDEVWQVLEAAAHAKGYEE